MQVTSWILVVMRLSTRRVEIAGIAPPDRVAGLVKELQNPASFKRRNGVPSLSADSAGYNADTGQYWRGAVWPSGQCMVQEGLRVCGQDDYARELGETYYAAQLEVFRNEKTIKENMAPDKPMGCGVADFVGWGGLGPVANLIESVLGFDLDAPGKTITWRITKTERHGISNLKLGDIRADIVCGARQAPGDPCALVVRSGGPFRLRILQNGKEMEKPIEKGEQQFVVK